MEELTFPSIGTKIPTEAAAYEFLEQLRWNGKPVCPHCGSIGEHYFLKPRNGISRETNRGSQTQRRLWKCRDCRQQFSVLTGTIMHGTHVSVRTWVSVFFEMVANKNGLAAREVERKYGLSPKSAWFLLHRIREAMKREPAAGLLSGVVITHETWIGGKPKNRHANKRVGSKQGKTDNTPIVSIIHAETGEVRAQVVANLSGKTLKAVMAKHVDAAAVHLQTDGAQIYKEMAGDFASHSSVDHKAGEYVREGVSTNEAENCFSQLKRSIDGTHHHVSPKHLGRYLGECDFRHSTHDETDSERMGRLKSPIVG